MVSFSSFGPFFWVSKGLCSIQTTRLKRLITFLVSIIFLAQLMTRLIQSLNIPLRPLLLSFSSFSHSELSSLFLAPLILFLLCSFLQLSSYVLCSSFFLLKTFFILPSTFSCLIITTRGASP